MKSSCNCPKIKNLFCQKALSFVYSECLHAYGPYIPIRAPFAGKPYFPHGSLSIFVTGGANIGKDCIIFQQVTIGSNTIEDSKRVGAPTLGDRVFLGAGAKIIGSVNIGDNVRVGANAVVTKDVPSNSTVVEFNRVIPAPEELDTRYVTYKDGQKHVFHNGQLVAADISD